MNAASCPNPARSILPAHAREVTRIVRCIACLANKEAGSVLDDLSHLCRIRAVCLMAYL